jgi:hypothetical protein
VVSSGRIKRRVISVVIRPIAIDDGLFNNSVAPPATVKAASSGLRVIGDQINACHVYLSAQV